MPRSFSWSAVLLGIATTCALGASLIPVGGEPLVDTILPLCEIIWRPEGTGEFVGSPSIVALPNGSYLATHVGASIPSNCRKLPLAAWHQYCLTCVQMLAHATAG